MTPAERIDKALKVWRAESMSSHSVHGSIKKYMADAIREAIAEEREACAKLVESFKTESPPGTVTFWGEGLAAAIRARATP